MSLVTQDVPEFNIEVQPIDPNALAPEVVQGFIADIENYANSVTIIREQSLDTERPAYPNLEETNYDS